MRAGVGQSFDVVRRQPIPMGRDESILCFARFACTPCVAAADGHISRMSLAPEPHSTLRRPVGRAVLVTWLVTAVWDLVCASALGIFAYGSTFSRFWQGVAAVALGPTALQMGVRGVAAGLALHLLVALAWSAIFVIAVTRWTALRRSLGRPATALGVAAIYGPMIWLVMSLAIIPLATGKLPAFAFRWWVQIFAHVPFVTLPLVFTARQAFGFGGGKSAV
jgi:hypothetical protein